MMPGSDKGAEQTLLLFALLPAIAISDTAVKAVGLGVVALVVLLLAALLSALAGQRLSRELHLIVTLLGTAALLGCVELLLNAYLPELHRALGPWLPLLVGTIVLLLYAAAELAPGRHAVIRVLHSGGAWLFALVLLGGAREMVGRGSLFHDAGALLGPWFADQARALELTVFRVDMGFLLAMLPPGAFIAMGLLFAVRNWLAQRNS